VIGVVQVWEKVCLNRETDIEIIFTVKWTHAARNAKWDHICNECFKIIERVFPIKD